MKTEKQKRAILKRNTKELVKNASKMMADSIDKAISCGAIDIGSYEGGYTLPRQILYALCLEVQHQYLFGNNLKKLKKEAENIYSCL